MDIFIEVSALEIYCENIRDLLTDKNVELKSLQSGKVKAVGQAWVRVGSASEFMEWVMISSQKRITKANAVHSRSSRSHHVFQIRINSQDPKGKKPKKSLLNVVDLAGSERRNNFRDDVDNYLPGQRKKSHKSTKSLYSEYNDMKMSQQGTNILEDTASEL